MRAADRTNASSGIFCETVIGHCMVRSYLVMQLAVEQRLNPDRPIATMLPKPLPASGILDAQRNRSVLWAVDAGGSL